MRITRRSFTGGLAALAVLAAGLAPAAAADLTKLTFVQEWPVPDGFWVPWILGSKKGFYEDEGIELEIHGSADRRRYDEVSRHRRSAEWPSPR